MEPLGAPAARIHHAIHRLDDPDAFGVAISGGRMEANFLTRVERSTVVEQFQATGWALDFQYAHVHARVKCPLQSNWMTLGFMRGGGASTWHGRAATQGTVMCNPPGEAIDGWFAPGFKCLSIGLPVKTWERCLLLAGVEPSNRAFACQLSPARFEENERQLRGTLELLQRAGGSPAYARIAACETESFVESLLVEALEGAARPEVANTSTRNRHRLALLAEEWMRAHLAESIQIPDVCVALHASRRELEYAFRATFDRSPRDFLLSLRLNVIHRALLDRSRLGSVMDIALDHGITHLGRFAADYRKLFGANPSDDKGRNGRADASKNPPSIKSARV